MKDRALRYFLAVVRMGSIRGAAEILNVAASAVSRQVAEMEAECGEVLLERLPRGVALTDAGRIVAEHAQRAADEADLLGERLNRMRGVRQGKVRIYCGAGFLVDLMDNAIAPLAADHAGLTFDVSLGTTDGILTAIAENTADIGLAYNPPAHPDVVGVKVTHQPLLAILPPAHPLSRSTGPVGLRAFADEPVALLPPDHGVRQLIGRVEAVEGFRLTARLETGSFELQRRFVTAGMGVAFLPVFTVLPELRAGTVSVLPLSDCLLQEAAAHLVVRARRRLPDIVGTAVEWLSDHLVALGADPPLLRD